MDSVEHMFYAINWHVFMFLSLSAFALAFYYFICLWHKFHKHIFVRFRFPISWTHIFVGFVSAKLTTKHRRENQKHKFIKHKLQFFNNFKWIFHYFFFLQSFSLFDVAEIKITPGSVSTDDDHLNFIGGEWWQLMMRGWMLDANEPEIKTEFNGVNNWKVFRN